MGSDAEEEPPPAPSLFALTTRELEADAVAASNKAAGLAALRQPGVSTALRTAMHITGNREVLPPAPIRSWLAEQYIHQRIAVDQHTASAVLYEAFSQSQVYILRNFPGTLPATYSSVTAAVSRPPSEEERVYSYNSNGCHVHYVLKTLLDDTPATQQGRDWWRNINLLPTTGKLDGMGSDQLWSFVSRRSGSLLHIDDADGTCSQLLGKKLWVLVDREEAARQHLVPVDADVMRDAPAGTHRFSSWQQCNSFQWCILHEGDTIATPRDRLHAVFCIGDVDSVSAGVYCWIAGTPSPFLINQEPRKRKLPPPPPPVPPDRLPIIPPRSTRQPLQPMARAALATLIADRQPVAIAAAKVGTSASSAQRWSKRARTTPSVADAPRSGRPRKTDEEEDVEIVEMAENEPFLSNHSIHQKLQLPVSNNTIQQRLDEAGLPSCIAAHKRHYTEAQRRARLSFANGYKHWTDADWEMVIFADQKTFEGAGRKRQQRVHRPPGHRFDPLYTKHRRLFVPSIHATCCICARGPGCCAVYDGKLDGKMLKNMLDRTIMQTARDYYDVERAERWWLLHDNSPVFKSGIVQTWVHNKGIQMIDFPPYSPDINIIENFWPRVSDVMDKAHARTPEAVEAAFNDAWNNIPLEHYITYAHSMPDRIAAIIEAKGDATKY
jgi:transposase